MSIDRNSPQWSERYRMMRETCGRHVGGEVARVAAQLRNPVDKLKFLRGTLDEQRQVPRALHYGVLKPASRVLRGGRLFVALGLVCATTAFALYVNDHDAKNHVPNVARPVVAASVTVAVPASPSIDTPQPSSSVAHPAPESMPVDSLGLAPSTIWLADHGANWELYSNGLRIETGYTVRGEPRHYRVHDKERGLQTLWRDKPIGILFHTSESDIWPLDTGYENELRRSSAALLKYVRQQRAYNYVIDRFGRVYRIVDDETRAHHAGFSIWANGNEVYLDLNSAFVGVSFESRWEGGRTLPITRAQLLAGRNLTNLLRQRFAIAPEMCVTHGITSVSPKQHLIGYHLDWARGFPFAAFGLPDHYAQPPPSMTLFGFTHGDDFVRTVGDGWPGALVAETVFARIALDLGMEVDALRAERRALFGKWLREVRAISDENKVADEKKAHSEPVPVSVNRPTTNAAQKPAPLNSLQRG